MALSIRSATKRKQLLRGARRRRIRAIVSGTKERPRLSVFRSGQHLFAQLINDEVGITVCSVSDAGLMPVGAGGRKEQLARAVGTALAEKAKAAGIGTVVFDRGGYAYHGRVKAVADGARTAGLIF